MAADALAIVEVCKSYGRRAAGDRVSLEIPSGTCLGLLGPNGAGKSTLINMLAHMTRPTSGDVLWRGRSIFAAPRAWRRAIGVVPEELALFEYLTMREHLLFSARMYDIPPEEAVRRTESLLRYLRLDGQEETLAGNASSGMRKKLALAPALVHSPRVLLLDEALSGVDPVSLEDIRDLLRTLVRRGVIVLLASHMIETVEVLFDRVAFMMSGRIHGFTPRSNRSSKCTTVTRAPAR